MLCPLNYFDLGRIIDYKIIFCVILTHHCHMSITKPIKVELLQK
jgi:hypothetical protein